MQVDLAVIGTGAAASTATFRCRKAGLHVAVVDSRPFGGTCVLRGCEPKKVLVDAADGLDRVRRMQGKGIEVGQPGINWRELIGFKRSFTDPVPRAREEAFAKAGIATWHGRARFVDRKTLAVGKERLEARHILIAAGAKPASLGIPGEELLTTSEGFLDLEALPETILFVGGGYVSFEFAHVAARAGAKVTVLHRGARPLAGFDPDLVDLLVNRTRELGVAVELETTVEGIEKSAEELAVHASTGAHGKRTFHAGLVVHGAGRVPDLDDLGLNEAGVEWDPKKGVHVDSHLRSVSSREVYAAGDAVRNGGYPLTPVATYDGEVVAANLLNQGDREVDYHGVPTVAFTIPPIASAGLEEAAARRQGLHFQKNYEETSGWYSSRRVAETCSGYKILVEEGSGRILGAHLVGPRADELINLFALAIRLNLPVSELKKAIFAFPTHASDLQSML